jgi:RNA polymerase sigma-70 factor (ECF subfamily)
MSDASLQTVQLHQYVQRWQGGDATAADALFRSIGQRLEHLARRMLRGYPNVRQWADTADVFQGTVWRLLNALRKLQPPTTRDFFNLAAAHVRRELLDLARRHAHREKPGSQRNLDSSCPDPEPVEAPSVPHDELELWTRFHEAVEHLPVEEREVFSLSFYHGWTQVQIAEILEVNERTVRRRWQAACLELNRRLGGQLPSI